MDKTSIGFSWLHNYWCELMATHAQNNEINTARPVAITAMAVLCISLGIFWYYAGKLFWPDSYGRRIVRSTGILSMTVVILLLTGEHDLVMNMAGVFGIIALAGTVIGLYHNRAYLLVLLGVICTLLVIVNNYIYYTGEFFHRLAVIQKITFLLFLLWFGLVSIHLHRTRRSVA